MSSRVTRSSVRPTIPRSAPVRPPDLIYALEEKPPPTQLVLLGFEFAAVIAPYLIFAALIFQASHVTPETAIHGASLAMLGIALATVLQAQRWGPVGSGFLAPPVISAIYFSPCIRAAGYGLPVVCAMTIVAGICETGFAWILPYLRKVFPPVVAGLIVMAVGVDLGLIGIRAFLGAAATELVHRGASGHSAISYSNLVGASLTLATMVAFGVWGKGLARLLCTLIGLGVGLAIALPLGLFSGKSVAAIASTPLLAIPDPRFLSYRLEYNLIVPFAFASLASGLRTIGVVTTCERMNDADWRRPDLDNVCAGVMADGIGCAIGGLLAAPGLSAAPSLVGMEKVTGATSRWIAYAIAGWFAVLACFPKFGAALLALPLPVVGAALLFNAGSMFVGGIQIVTSRPVTMRATFVIGLSFLIAVSRQVYPDFYTALPGWTDQFTGSMLSLVVFCGVLLNLIFLIGERRVQSVTIGDDSSMQLSKLLAAKSKEWQIDPRDLKRAEDAGEGLLHLIESGGHANGPIRAEIGYDDFDLTIALHYQGTLPYVASAQQLPAGMVEEQIFAVGLSGFLSSVLSDRLDSSCDKGACTMVLYFET